VRICRREFGRVALGGLAGAAFGAATRPKLLVIVVLDQFRSDFLAAIRSQLSPGGFRKILEKGAFFHNCLNRGSTFPSPSTATLATGAWPAQHGIVADRWYEGAIRRVVAASDEEMVATTLAAEVAADQRTRVTVIGMDRMRAALFAGTPDARLFWMTDQGSFAANTDVQDWVAAFNAQHRAENARNTKWVAIGARPDGPALRTLTYDPEHPEEFMLLYRSSPAAQQALFEFTSELIDRERMGQSAGLDVVCLLTGSMELLGYDTGARSPLMLQMALHLDKRLEQLFTVLARSPGEGAFNLALAGGHGIPPEPAPESRARMAVRGDDVAATVQKLLAASATGRVEKYIYPFLYLATDSVRDPEPFRLAAARAAMQHPAVAGYFTAGGACSVHNEWEQRFRNSFHPQRSGDVMLSYRPEFVESYGQDRGISYGSLYNYDAVVPLGFYGPQFRPGEHEQMVQSVDFAPTLARAIGVAPPSSSTGRALAEALAE
jgi:Type I phosphodiesterase / nucleotide pyrophosphatase